MCGPRAPRGSRSTRSRVRHVLPNSLLPVVTVVGFAMLTGILGGAFFTETLLLGINGIGRFTVRGRTQP